MCSAIEKAMKAAEVSYEPEQPVADKEIKAPVTAVAEAKKSVEEQMKEKLAPYTPDRFRKEEVEDIRQIISDMRKTVSEIEARTDSTNPVGIIVCAKALDKSTGKLSKILIPYANAQYLKGNYDVPEAKIAKYSQRRKWRYSKALTKEIEVLEAKKEIEQKSGDAVDISPPVDVTVSKIFTVSLKNNK